MKVIPSFVKPATDNRLLHIMTALGNANPHLFHRNFHDRQTEED
jgi:hypothetical protein